MERFLTSFFGRDPVPVEGKTTRAQLVRTEDFDKAASALHPPVLTIYLYRVDVNHVVRAGWSGVGHLDGRAHLPLDLHFLLTAWADNAESEYRILGAAMECLETTPILSGPLLAATGAWATNEAIQVCTGEMSTEEVMRTFDSLPTDYKLSVPYVARVVRVDSRTATPDPPTVTVVTGITPSVRT